MDWRRGSMRSMAPPCHAGKHHCIIAQPSHSSIPSSYSFPFRLLWTECLPLWCWLACAAVSCGVTVPASAVLLMFAAPPPVASSVVRLFCVPCMMYRSLRIVALWLAFLSLLPLSPFLSSRPFPRPLCPPVRTPMQCCCVP
jgi:hypothetical protein